MPILLWELAGADPDRRFSPYCWRIRMSLRHKGLDFVTRPWRFTEKDRIAFTGQGKVPVIEDGEKRVHDSWAIAEYLDEAYPDLPSIFGGAAAKSIARFVTDWAEGVVQSGMAPMLMADIWAIADAKDQAYFRASREKFWGGRKLEEVQADRDERLPTFRKSLDPLRRMLRHQPFIAGASPAWPDFAVFGPFQWARCVSPYKLLADDDPVHAWRARMLDRFEGEAARAVGFAA